jgi:hypothetical protein
MIQIKNPQNMPKKLTNLNENPCPAYTCRINKSDIFTMTGNKSAKSSNQNNGGALMSSFGINPPRMISGPGQKQPTNEKNNNCHVISVIIKSKESAVQTNNL